ncbi:hypothetical protein BDN71DRAFT_229997 [Pleurotus eryngii]|uniref:Uncharacterized protein n=1 Tax=Pleurotus eryngii TaxID=5323 RepID=A0A9P6A3I9_PLEER|nr:hypothetical protein BDN71DRAFT_229997 [Pleurotus eryngii]
MYSGWLRNIRGTGILREGGSCCRKRAVDGRGRFNGRTTILDRPQFIDILASWIGFATRQSISARNTLYRRSHGGSRDQSNEWLKKSEVSHRTRGKGNNAGLVANMVGENKRQDGENCQIWVQRGQPLSWRLGLEGNACLDVEKMGEDGNKARAVGSIVPAEW